MASVEARVHSPARWPTAWVVVPAVCSAVLAGAVVLIVVNGAHSAGYHLSGGTMAVVWVLGGLILAVVVGTLVAAARSSVRAAAEADYLEDDDRTVKVPLLIPPPPQATRAAQTAQIPQTAQSPPMPAVPPPPAAVGADEGGDLQVIHAQLVGRLLTRALRQIDRLDELKNEVEDPRLLKALSDLDHQATQVRRYGENLAVLVGALSPRQWTEPVPLTVVQRSAVSEAPDHPRVQVIPRAPGRLHGHAVADVTHILSELVENATNYSNPNTKVTIGAHRVSAGLAIEIDDHGIGMDQEQFQRLNTLLRDPSGGNARDLLSQGRIGLSVVAKTAQRHGIAVELQTNVTGGTLALVVIPDALLAPEESPAGEQGQARDTAQLPATPGLAPSGGNGAGSPTMAPVTPQPQQAQAQAAVRQQPQVPTSQPQLVAPELKPDVALSPDGRPQQHRGAPQGHISSRQLQAGEPQQNPQTPMSDFWQGASSGAAPSTPTTPTAARTEPLYASPSASGATWTVDPLPVRPRPAEPRYAPQPVPPSMPPPAPQPTTPPTVPQPVPVPPSMPPTVPQPVPPTLPYYRPPATADYSQPPSQAYEPPAAPHPAPPSDYPQEGGS